MSSSPVLAFSPHTDDAEIGCGGLIQRFLKQKRSVIIFIYSTSIDGPAEWEMSECWQSLKILGVEGQHLGYRDMTLWQHRDRILDHMIWLKNTINPGLILVPATYDCHQDHQVVTQEAMRAFKHSSILGYDLPWDSIIPSKVNVFAPLSEEEMELKLKALSCYKSQSTKSYFQPGVMRSIATMRGIQCGQPLAEAYEAIRWIISL